MSETVGVMLGMDVMHCVGGCDAWCGCVCGPDAVCVGLTLWV